MGPIRSTSSGHKPHTKHPQRKERESNTQSSLPGVQKIKSSLRQTRRLLAKDDLAADVRRETERRLKSLEGDLAKAERARKERNIAVKYHKVKFFERQKVCRKIKHAKKRLDAPDTPPESLPSLRETLFSYRVDLNYILHYPKTKKYISLFPPESSKVASGSSETDEQREELRQWVSTAMKEGEMDSEPEERMDKGVQIDGMDWLEEGSSTIPRRKGKQKDMGTRKPKGVPGDAFFEALDEASGADDDHMNDDS